MFGCGLGSSTAEISECRGHSIIAPVTVSATTISNKLILKRKTSYKRDVIYQKSFGTEDGKPLEYNRNPAKKYVPHPHLQTLLSTLHLNVPEELTSVLRVGAKWSYCSWNTRKEMPSTERLNCFHCWYLSTSIVWADDSGVTALGIGWSQTVPLRKGKHFHRMRQETSELLLKIWLPLQLNLLPIVVQFQKKKLSSVLCMTMPYKVTDHCIITVSLY